MWGTWEWGHERMGTWGTGDVRTQETHEVWGHGDMRDMTWETHGVWGHGGTVTWGVGGMGYVGTRDGAQGDTGTWVTRRVTPLHPPLQATRWRSASSAGTRPKVGATRVPGGG